MPNYVFLIALHVFAVIWGLHSGSTDRTTPFGMLFFVVAGVLIVSACMTDARRRRKPIGGSIQMVMLFAWPIAAPLYLIWSRGWRGALWAALWMVTLYSCYLFPAAYIEMRRANAA
jgi:hypothetical protein